MVKIECKNLDAEKPHCYPWGYEHCKLNGKICFFKAYNHDVTKCNCFEAKTEIPKDPKERLKEITYVFLINTDVPMTGGKVAAQVSNVACQLPKVNLRELEEPCTLILGAPESLMLALIKVYESKLKLKYTVDCGFTEFTTGVITCLGWKYQDWAEPITHTLPLWKEGLKS
jgi:peptidyl-tRNA hydrolase